MTVLRPSSPVTGIFQPSWGRGVFALVLAVGGFLLPQEVPLVWYPLNHPGNDILYLELTCQANKTGEIQVFYDSTRGINELDSIKLPISPTPHAYTSIFPLPDAPITELRLDPVGQGGTLTITRFRIVDRRGTEIRRFTRDMFVPLNQIAAITPTPDGWAITSTPGAGDPYTRIELYSAIVPVGYAGRNLHRCLLSCGYLAAMLAVILLAVWLIFERPRAWREVPAPAFFLAVIAGLFSIVGNRGLIRESFHVARYVAPRVPPGLRLEFDLVSSGPATARLFPDTGQGDKKAEGVSQEYEPHQGLQILRFPLSDQTLQGLRFEPRDRAGRLEIRGIRVVDAGQRTRAVLPLDSLVAEKGIARLDRTADSLTVDTENGATELMLEFSPAAIAEIDRALASDRR